MRWFRRPSEGGQAAGIEIRYLGPVALGRLVKDDTAYWSGPIKSWNITAD